MKARQNGNAILLILIGVALLATLTYAISREGGEDQKINHLTESQLQLEASKVVNMISSAEIAVEQLSQWGIKVEDILFDEPDESGYTTNPSRQIHHPSGGGMSHFPKSDYIGSDIWNNTTNVEWTKTTATDLLYRIALKDNADLCAAVNKLILGTPDIPETSASFDISGHFKHDTTGSHDDFLVSECPDCEDKKTACIYVPSGTTGTPYVVYSIIIGR